MSKINRTLHAMTAAALLPLLATASNAFASPAQPAIGQQVRIFGDPDSGGEVKLRTHFGFARWTSLELAGNGDVIVIGPGGGKPPKRPSLAKAAEVTGGSGPIIIHGPGGQKPPARSNLATATLETDGVTVHGPGGGKPPTRPGIVNLATGGNDGTPVGGPGGSGKPPIRPHIFGSAKRA